MANVIVSKNVVVHPDTKQRTVAQVYHIIGEMGCKNSPKKDSPHYFEVEEDIAIALGKSLCGSCALARHRYLIRAELEHMAQNVLTAGLQDFVDIVPSNIEIRILAHSVDGKKTPITVWTNKPKED